MQIVFNTRVKALDEIYKICYTYASLGEKNRIENEIMKMYTPLHSFESEVEKSVGKQHLDP